MLLKRLTLPIACVLLVLGTAGTASAKTYSLGANSGAQLQIGGGLPLPIQLTSPAATGTMFPTLLIPKAVGATVQGTTAMTVRQQLTIPPTVLSKPAVQKTVGVFGQNPALYAVATNLQFIWPTQAVTLNTTKRTGAAVNQAWTTALGNNVVYNAPAAGKFGGPARFAINPQTGQGVIPAVGVTIYGVAVPGPGNPPCTHTALTPVPFPGPGNALCIAGLAQALPVGPAAIGGTAGTTSPFGVLVTTPGGTPAAVAAGGPVPGVGIGKFGPVPTGTVSFFAFTPAGTMTGFTNMATSRGFPHTVGQIAMSAPLAAGAPEVFTITGQDNRTAGGNGTLQLVSGAVSQRTLSGPNANRGWVRLEIADFTQTAVPAMSTGGIALLGGSLLALGVFAIVRRNRHQVSA